MKVISIEITMTQEQYDCLVEQSSKYEDNSSIEAQLESVVSSELHDMIDWSNTTVDSNNIEVNAVTREVING